MKVPVQWLKDYVEIEDLNIQALVEKLIMTGSNSEGVHNICEGLEKIVIGKIVTILPHPNADKLSVCSIDIGDECVQIVTGATNIATGDCIPVALHGSTIAGGTKIKKGKLRGEESNGMLCSLEELGFEASSIPKDYDDGIYILDKDYPLGVDFIQYFGLDLPTIEFEITPNRPDCLSLLGMARETKASFERTLKVPDAVRKEEGSDIDKYASVNIEDADLCNRYVAKVVNNIKIKPSPVWMQLRLMLAGMRPINNIVDITNYVMLEYGQPIHAFDLSTVKNGSIVVRRAHNQETITTLDDKVRILDSEMLVIADEERAIAIAGVMGGANTEITDKTNAILVEVASFDKSSIRKTSKMLGLRSEASSRFEKGVSSAIALDAANRVCNLIEQLGAGTVVPGVIDNYPVPKKVTTIPYTAEKINSVIGTQLSDVEIVNLFKRLDIQVEDGKAMVPVYRLDLEKEIDLVEEIARLYGYDAIGMTLPKMNAWGGMTNGQIIENNAKLELIACGVDEILTYSFVSKGDLDLIKVPQDSTMRELVELINPLGEEFSVMRRTLMPNLLGVLSRNFNRKIQNVRIFELGSVFIPKQVPVEELPYEKKMLTIGIYGEQEDFFTLKGIVESLLKGLGIEGHYFDAEKNHTTFHGGRCANLILGAHVLGTIGEVHPLVLENYDINTRAYIADLDFNILLQLAKETKLYKQVPKYPAIERDLAILVEDVITSHQIETIVRNTTGKLLESVKLFDMYKGKQIPDGYKSLAYSLIFRAEDRTLSDDEVNPLVKKLLSTLEIEVKAQLR